jgi:arginyl-tRNA--protein-N-Asp/Glu arginylyltransferase
MAYGPESKASLREWPLAAGGGLPLPFRQFFTTVPVACPYVAGRAERKLVVELSGKGAGRSYDDLSRAGFRRSHRFAYRPACALCASCVPVRIAVERFSHSRSTRRIRNLNRDLRASLTPSHATVEQFRLFRAYQRRRHGDSEMAEMSFADYRAMIEDTPVRTEILEFRDAGETLLAVSLIDRLDDGVSAVYSFYEPRSEKRSLGNWCILWLVEDCRRRAAPYVYLGYWIAESPKMSYKSRFTGLERLAASGWVRFEADAGHD